jgi:hypothetical protein
MSEVQRYSARKLLQISTAEIARIFKGKMILVFDDGEMLTSARETVYSSIFWDFHRMVPEMPMLKSHHVRSCLGEFAVDGIDWKTQKYYNSKMHNEVGKHVYWTAHGIRNKDRPHRFDKELNKQYFKTINNLYNFLASLNGYELSFNDREYLEIRFHPFVDAAQKRLTRDPKVISDTTKEVLNFVKTSPDFDNNSLAKSVRAGLVREMQFMQCILVRGYVEDIDNNIFEEPILHGFLDGLSQFENMIESRAASKSLLYNKKVIQFVEYFSRTLQLQAMIVKNLHKGDCGSDSYLRWSVRPSLFDSVTGRGIRDCDLKNLQGKYYKLNYEDKELKVLKASDTHLIGETILLRSPIAGCKHPDPHGICSVCFGSLASSYDEHNLGEQCAAEIAAGQTQNVLSQKHAQSSSVADPIVIDDENKMVFVTNDTKDSYILNDQIMGKDFYIVLAKSECPGFIDLDYVNNVEEIGSITHATELTAVTFVIRNPDFEDRYTIPVSMGSRRSSLSLEMLDYIKQNRPVIKDDNYVIDMKNWRSKAPFATLPLSQESPYVRAARIQSLVLGDAKNSNDRDTSEAPRALTQKLFDLLNANLSISLPLIEVVVYSLMVRNTTGNDYFLPKEGDRMGLGVNSRVMSKRSLGGLMAMEDHARVILDPESYDDRARLDHTYDVMLKPQEHVTKYDPEALVSNF